MANPQLETGYTRIANELLEEVYSTDFNGTEYKIILCIWRYTYGFQRKQHGLSESFIASAIGRHKKQVGQTVADLIERKVISVIREATFSSPRVLAINKNYTEWEGKEGQGVNLLPPSENTITTGSKFTTTPGSKFTPQEKKNIKKKKESIVEQSSTGYIYGEIIEYLNKKTGKNFKKGSKSTHRHINARLAEGFSLEDFKKVIDCKVSEWAGNDMEKYLRPETLFGTKFEGYLNAAPAAPTPRHGEIEDGKAQIDLWSDD